MRTIAKVGIAALSVTALSIGGIAGVNALDAALQQPQTDGNSRIAEMPVPTETPSQSAAPIDPAEIPAPEVLPEPVPLDIPVEEPQEDPAPEPEPYVPTLCPEGTRANAVDELGNESNCEPLGPTGEQCVAYNDANECTAWLENQ